LTRRDDLLQKRSQTVHNAFRDNLINDVVETVGSKIYTYSNIYLLLGTNLVIQLGPKTYIELIVTMHACMSIIDEAEAGTGAGMATSAALAG
jgi:hypothetical protein